MVNTGYEHLTDAIVTKDQNERIQVKGHERKCTELSFTFETITVVPSFIAKIVNYCLTYLLELVS